MGLNALDEVGVSLGPWVLLKRVMGLTVALFGSGEEALENQKMRLLGNRLTV
jgi:hypothetical protein